MVPGSPLERARSRASAFRPRRCRSTEQDVLRMTPVRPVAWRPHAARRDSDGRTRSRNFRKVGQVAWFHRTGASFVDRRPGHGVQAPCAQVQDPVLDVQGPGSESNSSGRTVRSAMDRACARVPFTPAMFSEPKHHATPVDVVALPGAVGRRALLRDLVGAGLREAAVVPLPPLPGPVDPGVPQVGGSAGGP